jgi:hypothetical protein
MLTATIEKPFGSSAMRAFASDCIVAISRTNVPSPIAYTTAASRSDIATTTAMPIA